MFNWLKRKTAYAAAKTRHSKQPDLERVDADIQVNHDYLKRILGESTDIIFREISIGKAELVSALIVGIDGLFDAIRINENVIRPLMKIDPEESVSPLCTAVENRILSVTAIKKEDYLTRAVDLLMKGDVLLFIDGCSQVLIVGARTWEQRAIQEPTTETSVLGPRESFTETLKTNTSMVRRHIRHPKLKIHMMTIGRFSRTDVALAYVEGIASDGIINEVKQRLKRIDIDTVTGAGYIEEMIADSPLSIFPTVAYTERPDIVSSRLLEGRVAILCEGSPISLVVPHLLMESFHNVDDYYSRPYYSSLMRFMRFISFLIATMLPGVFVAAQSYHKEMFPTDLLISVAAAREGVPFHLFFEVLGLTLAFELLKESGIRMPSSLGQAIAIVGGLVLGEAAVQAGIVGTPTVIIIALTAITTFLVPSLNDTTGLLRIIYLFAGGLLGMFGVMLVISFTILHLVSLRSAGIPFMAPLAPITWSGWKDLFIRVPFWRYNRRPEILPSNNEVRQGTGQKPAPPSEEGEKE